MSGTSSDLPFAEFIDDYFAECDEHLTLARQCLLALEGSVGNSDLDANVVNDLFRSFHSIKGLSAMVGVREAESLAHQMESYLSALRRLRITLTKTGFETLLKGVAALEQVIAARQENAAPPSIEAISARLGELLRSEISPTAPSASAPHQAERPIDSSSKSPDALPNERRQWTIVFSPSREASARGLNVNTVRERLKHVGEVISATPSVGTDGKISFRFVLASDEHESTFDEWRQDGLAVSLAEGLTAPAAVPQEGRHELNEAAREVSPSRLMPSNVVRVDLERLDELMRLVGDLVVSRSRLQQELERVGGSGGRHESRALDEINHAMERQLRDLRDGLMRVRLVPIGEIFTRMHFVVRDLIGDQGKQASLLIRGETTEIDKFLVERMMDPLLHLVRNAISHGLETPDERRAAGKPPAGSLELRASANGETIQIELEDDGRGIDRNTVLRRAREAGLVPATIVALDDASLLDVLCSPGFSTRDEADRASGRGVGMAVVRSTVEELGGTILLETEPGMGTRFSIQLPLTLAIADSLIVEVAGQLYAIPQVAVREVLKLQPADLTTMENNELIRHRDTVLPLVRLSELFGKPMRRDGAFHALVVGFGLSGLAIGVERVVGLREIVVRALNDPLIRVPGISGATELGDGRVVLILDTAQLVRTFSRRSASSERNDSGMQRPRTIGTSASS